MKIAFASTADPRDIRKYSGTPFYMTKELAAHGIEMDYLAKLKASVSPAFKLKRFWQERLCGVELSSRFQLDTVKQYARQIERLLPATNADVVMSHVANPLAFLDCKQPVVLWTDALYAALAGYISQFSHHAEETMAAANTLTQAALSRCRLAIFSSDWAARSALELYGTEQHKVKVVPFGANIDCQHTLADVREWVKQRSRERVQLLFLGKEWERKGGDKALAVAKALHAARQPVELHLVGCQPPKGTVIPAYVHCHGYVSKQTPAGVEKITRLLRESHFLFVPSRAEAFGIVFCEANAYGLPCLTSCVGGITTIIKDDVNGKTFSLNTTPEQYGDYIAGLMQNYSRYEEMALAAFQEYKTRLNWQVATQQIKQLIQEII